MYKVNFRSDYCMLVEYLQTSPTFWKKKKTLRNIIYKVQIQEIEF